MVPLTKMVMLTIRVNVANAHCPYYPPEWPIFSLPPTDVCIEYCSPVHFIQFHAVFGENCKNNSFAPSA